ncbi:MAG TPA: substrate-binding domain-containing protein [Solirubrobacteraceae bacterium]|jgi:ABC-type phosphate transport system substrate-binding protein|nr:substrate-binding domain-containing protein [Solirubrobacteraceae bacterium]
MRHLSARGIMLACLAAIAALALAVPGSALAKGNPNQCSGVAIEFKGSSFQKSLQLKLDPAFNASPAKTACNGSQGSKGKPGITYHSTGSGCALRTWGIENQGLGAGGVECNETINYGPTTALAATDDPPNPNQIKEVEAQESKPTEESVLTIPVASGAITIIMHLPTNCEGTSAWTAGRLVIGDKELEGVFAGTVKKWGELKAGGDKLTGTGGKTNEECENEKIQPAVRKDESGSTHILDKFLFLTDKGSLADAKGSHTWAERAEGAINTTWPTAANVATPSGTGGGKLAELVANTPGDIGYVDLATARGNSAFGSAGGANHPTFWAEVESENKKGKAKYAEPSLNGENGTTSTANCKKTVYANYKEGKEEPFPPPAATEAWNEVTTKTSEKTYPLCGLTYVVSLTKYSLVPGTSKEEVQTVEDFVKFMLDKKGGQKIDGEGDYFPLPKPVASLALGGAAQIGD